MTGQFSVTAKNRDNNDEVALFHLVQFCSQHGITFVSTERGEDITLTFTDTGNSGQFRVLRSYTYMIHTIEQDKAR